MTTREVREFYTLSLLVSETLLRAESSSAVLRDGLREVAQLVHADMALLHLEDAGSFHLAAAYGFQNVPVSHHIQTPSKTDLDSLKMGLWLHWRLPEGYEGPVQNNYASLGASQAIAIGLRSGSELVGYAGFLFRERADRSELMSALGTLGAIWGLQYARLLESEQRNYAESQLRLYRAALDNLHDMVIITETNPLDPPGPVITYVNRRVKEKTGYYPSELIGQNPRVLQGPDTDPNELRRIKAKLSQFEPVTAELVNYTKEGNPYWILLAIHPFSIDDGPPTHFVSVQTDITERKQAESAVAHLAAIVTFSTDAIVGMTTEGIVTSWNAAAEQMFGYSAAEMLGLPILKLIPPERHAIEQSILARVCAGERIDHYEAVRLTKDGHMIDVSLSRSPVRDSQGRVIGVSKIARDISEEKRVKERFRQVLEGTGAGVWDHDLLTGKMYWSQEFRELFGLGSQEPPDPNVFRQFVHPDDLSRIAFNLKTGLEGGPRKWTQEFRIRLADGTERWLQDTVWVNRDCTGRAASLGGVTLDVTERNATEQKVSDYEHKLEVEVARLQSLRQIDQAITASTDVSLIAKILLDEMVRQLGVKRCGLYRVYRGTLQLQLIAHRGLAIEMKEDQPIFEMAALAMRQRESKELSLSEYDYGSDAGTLWLLPLIVKGQVKGMLIAEYSFAGPVDAEWKEFLTTLAGQAAIALDSAELFEELQRSNAELQYAYDRTIEGWARALDLRDKETEGHSRRVTDLTLQLAKTMGLSGEKLVHVRRGALLHDIGKMGVPDSILLKPGPLTPEEREIMQQHTILAQRMLQPIEFLRPALDIPLYHHERWDGAGYPYGLHGEEIPLAARMFAIVDVFDALSSDRPYRPAWSRQRVLEHIQSLSGSHFDPEVVQAFLRMVTVEE